MYLELKYIHLSIYLIIFPIISPSKNVRPKFRVKDQNSTADQHVLRLVSYIVCGVCVYIVRINLNAESSLGGGSEVSPSRASGLKNASSTVNKLSPDRYTPPYTIPAKEPPTRERERDTSRACTIRVYVLNFTNVWHRSVISPARRANRRISRNLVGMSLLFLFKYSAGIRTIVNPSRFTFIRDVLL